MRVDMTQCVHPLSFIALTKGPWFGAWPTLMTTKGIFLLLMSFDTKTPLWVTIVSILEGSLSCWFCCGLEAEGLPCQFFDWAFFTFLM